MSKDKSIPVTDEEAEEHRKYRVAVVEWLDAVKVGRLMALPYTLTPVLCISCGFVYEENDEWITLITEFTDDDRAENFNTIPRGMITDMRYMEEK